MDQTQVLRIQKVIYGLLHAPRAWLEKLGNVLKSHGWYQSRLEPCVWRLYDSNDVLVGLLGAHVDDMLCCGSGSLYEEKVRLLRSSFPFGSWQHAKSEQITFCGCEISQKASGDIHVSQERYALGINEIQMSTHRKTQVDQPATPFETKQLRATLGALSWRATQTCPWICASVSILQGSQTQATVNDLLQASKLVRAQRIACEEVVCFSANITKPILIIPILMRVGVVVVMVVRRVVSLRFWLMRLFWMVLVVLFLLYLGKVESYRASLDRRLRPKSKWQVQLLIRMSL